MAPLQREQIVCDARQIVLCGAIRLLRAAGRRGLPYRAGRRCAYPDGGRRRVPGDRLKLRRTRLAVFRYPRPGTRRDRARTRRVCRHRRCRPGPSRRRPLRGRWRPSAPHPAVPDRPPPAHRLSPYRPAPVPSRSSTLCSRPSGSRPASRPRPRRFPPLVGCCRPGTG
jgi:hypothetical protein